MPKHIYPLKPCPWCRKTPKFYMFLGAGGQKQETWLPEIHCSNYECSMVAKTKYIPIRKKQKKDPVVIKEKLERLIARWNDNNPLIATEGIELDFIEIATME